MRLKILFFTIYRIFIKEFFKQRPEYERKIMVHSNISCRFLAFVFICNVFFPAISISKTYKIFRDEEKCLRSKKFYGYVMS